MERYEIMYIVKATIDSDLITKTGDNFKNLFNDKNSKILEFKSLGEKKFAYPIKKETNGYYFLLVVESSPEVIKEFERKSLIDDNLLRHLIIKLSEE